MRISLFLVILFLLRYSCIAQTEKELAVHSGKQRITLALGHTHVSQGRVEDQTRWLALPSWSLNYDYQLTTKSGIGIQTDLIVENFVVETKDDKLLERNTPFAAALVYLYKLSPSFRLITGAGIEMAHNKNIGFTRLGLEYGLHLNHKWEAGAALLWDGKWQYYNSWGLGFTIGRLID